MRPSTIITAALILNTSILFAQGLDLMANTLPVWALSSLETFLVFAFLVNRTLGVFAKAFAIDFGNLNVLVQNANSNQGHASLFESNHILESKNDSVTNEIDVVDSQVQYA